jgi:hypothetical protein
MPGRLYLPDEVRSAIGGHLRQAIEATIEDYPSASEDEDTLVGHFGAKAQIRNQKVMVDNPEVGGLWAWSIEYVKFRGRGAKATENLLGADGILRLAINYGGRAEEKSALFQAKIEGRSDRDLLTQCAKLSTWREAAFVLNFRDDNIEAVTLDAAFRGYRTASKLLRGEALDEFFEQQFVPCKIGDPYLSYDAIRKVLKWRAMNNKGQERFVATRFLVRHRLGINVRAPQRARSAWSPPLIKADDIYNYRMSANFEDIFDLQPGFTERDLKAKRKELADIYHPDRYVDMKPTQEAAEILERRMQEFNSFVDELKSSSRRR